MKHTPIQRIRNTPIGATIFVPGVTTYSAKRSLYLGGRDEEGFGLLWPSFDCWKQGLKWVVMATASHPVELVK